MGMATTEAQLARKYDSVMLARTISWLTDGRRLGTAQVRLLAALQTEAAARQL